MNEEKTIEASISEFIRVYNAGDLEGVLAYYSDDLINLGAGTAGVPACPRGT